MVSYTVLSLNTRATDSEGAVAPRRAQNLARCWAGYGEAREVRYPGRGLPNMPEEPLVRVGRVHHTVCNLLGLVSLKAASSIRLDSSRDEYVQLIGQVSPLQGSVLSS